MIEPVFGRGFEAAMVDLGNMPDTQQADRDQALIWRATHAAIKGALSYGIDFPVGAVAAAGDMIVGSGFASDKRTGRRQMHAERMAHEDSQIGGILYEAPKLDTIGVSLEPCPECQDFLATIPGLKRVVFGLPRKDVERRGLVKRHKESIFDRAARVRLPYELVQIDSPIVLQTGRIILDHTKRDLQKETVEIARASLKQALREHNTKQQQQD